MVRTSVKRNQGNFFLRIMPVQRFIISLILAVIVFLLMINSNLDILVNIMIAWSVFALSYIVTSWIVFFGQKPAQIRELSKQEDGSRLYVFSLIIITSFASLISVLLLMLSQNSNDTPPVIFIPVALSCMLFSWVMVHTLFGFHYAHLYYGDDTNDSTKHAEGLEFPGEKKPDYVDFAYFSFVVGMTFQVSDTAVHSRMIRRLVLLHGLISFGLNTFVVALTINLIAGLLK
ncbi:MAG TPA: DUF1345 domain-containing protein [Chitinophagaceae bacterium]|nr:DUF1345 domain-containing protein [Chitinophagaceae bacterium]